MNAEIIQDKDNIKELSGTKDIDVNDFAELDQDQEVLEKKYADVISTEIDKQDNFKNVDQYYKDSFIKVFSNTISESNLTEDQSKEIISKLIKYYESLSKSIGTSDAFEQMYVFDRLNGESNKEVAKTVVNNLDSFNELLSFNDKGYSVFSIMTLLKFGSIRNTFNNNFEFRKDLGQLFQMGGYVESKIENEESGNLLVSNIKHFLEMGKYLGENSKEGEKTTFDVILYRIFNTEKLRTIFEKNPDKIVKLFIDISKNIEKRRVEGAIRESMSNESRMIDALEKVISDNDPNEYEDFLNVYIAIDDHAIQYNLEEAAFINLSKEGFRSTVRTAIFGTGDDKINALYELSILD